jgi:O-antigen ligase
MQIACCGLLALMVSGPFLLPFHYAPIGNFWNEWFAIALGLGAALFGLIEFRNRNIWGFLPLPIPLLIPAALLVALIVQFAFHRITFSQIGMLYAIYLLWASLLISLGRHLSESLKLHRLAIILATSIAIGATISSTIGLTQWLGLTEGIAWIHPVRSVSANIAQNNHFAQYAWLGIASLLYLSEAGFLKRFQLWPLLMLNITASAGSGSRSIFLYPLVLIAVIAWMRSKSDQKPSPSTIVDTAMLLPALIAFNAILVAITAYSSELSSIFALFNAGSQFDPGKAATISAQASGSRLLENPDSAGFRIAFLKTSWAAFLEHPWIGNGAGNFAWASFEVASKASAGNLIVGENAHNLVFQLLAEFGVPVAVAVVLLLAIWATQFLQANWKAEHAWCASLLGIFAIHSMLEYPLWYSYFLGPTALLLGATSSGKAHVLTGKRIAVYLAIAGIVGGTILGKARTDYIELSTTVDNPYAADSNKETSWWISVDRLLKLHEESLLSPWATQTLLFISEPSKKSGGIRADACQYAIRFSADRKLITQCAIHLAIAGRKDEAQELTTAVLKAFPKQRTETRNEIRKVAENFPEVRLLQINNQQ